MKFPGTQALIVGFVCTLPETLLRSASYRRIQKEIFHKEVFQKEMFHKEGTARETFTLPNAYIRLDKDDILTVMLPEHQCRWAVVGEMIDADVRNVRMEIIPKREQRIYTSLHPEVLARMEEFCRWNLLHALAVARRMLIYAAALRWNLPSEQCTTQGGFVHNTVTQDSLRYSELIPDAVTLSPLR